MIIEVLDEVEAQRIADSLDSERYTLYYTISQIILRPNVSSKNLDTFYLKFSNINSQRNIVNTWKGKKYFISSFHFKDDANI
jgi:hypothetical protein